MTAASVAFTGPSHYEEDLAPFTFAPFAAALVERMPQDLDGDILEIACGTGVVTRALRRRLPSVRLTATDLSPVMLAYARSRSADDAAIRWLEADATSLPFDSGSFAAVVCGFGFMFAPDRNKALAEARRVLAADGWLFFSVWDRIEDNPHALANASVVEGLFPDDPQMKFRLPYELHDEQQLRVMLAAAGLRDVRIERRRIPFAGIDPHRLARGQIRGTPRSALLEERGVSLDEVIDKIAAALARQGGDPYEGYAQGLLVEARAG